MTRAERSTLRAGWPEASVVDRDVVLGTPLGHGITTSDFARKAMGVFTTRIATLRTTRMSLAMRIYTVNCFLYSLFSYFSRMLIMPQPIVNNIVNAALGYISPVPFCTAFCLSHLRAFVGASTELRDFQLDNIAAVLASTIKLQATGCWDASRVDTWIHDVMQLDVVVDGRRASASTHTPRPIAHFALAYDAFVGITGKNLIERGRNA